MKIQIEEQNVTCEEGTRLFQIALKTQDQYPHAIILALVNGKLQELFHEVREGDRIQFVTTADRIGYETYRRSCSMLFLAAVHRVLKDESFHVILHFSIDAGFFFTLEGNQNLKVTEELLQNITNEMQDMAKEGLRFQKSSIKTDEAMKLFHSLGMYDKEKLFSTRLGSTVNIYELSGYLDYYYGYMAFDTSVLQYFRLYSYHNGIVLQMPERVEPEKVPEFKPYEKLFNAQVCGERWAEQQGIATVADLNDRVIQSGGKNAILISEALMEKEISRIASKIAERTDVKFVMIAGPSSSGKTTFSQRLAVQLEAAGLIPHYIGVDNYFKNRDTVPLDEYGKKDFESLRAVDVDQFNSDMTDLLNGKTIRVPTFDFLTGRRVYNGETLHLNDGEILVIEGIHCLNDALSYSLPGSSKFKIYISALTQVNVDEHNRISTTDGRLIRRIVRDYRTRGYSASNTLAMWDSVRRGEENYIFPFQETADVFFNSALPYELSVLKLYAEPLLFQVKRDDPEYNEARRLLKFLNYWIGIPAVEYVPNNSILREFIGGGCFHL